MGSRAERSEFKGFSAMLRTAAVRGKCRIRAEVGEGGRNRLQVCLLEYRQYTPLKKQERKKKRAAVKKEVDAHEGLC